MTVVAPVFTLQFNLIVKSEMPIESVVAFKESRFQKFKDADGIARRGKNVKRTMAPPPTQIDKHKVTWTLDNLQASAVYYTILYFAEDNSPPNAISSAARTTPAESHRSGQAAHAWQT
jgi:hypothetical protein